MCPLRRFAESWAPSQPDVTVVLAASRGAGCACECCVSCRSGAFGLRRSHHCLAVSGGPRWCSEASRRPEFQRSRGHPRVRFALLQSWSCPASARSLAFPGAFHGVWFLVATSIQRVTYRRASRLAYVPPTAFRTLSTAYSSLSLADLFRSAATSRIPRRGCSPGQAVPPRRWPLPSRRWRRASVAGVTRRRQAASRRPQGLAPGRDPVRDLEGLARGRVRVPSLASPSDSSCQSCPGDEPRLHPRPCRAPLECCARWPWRIDRPTASMLYL